jgi:hypothetical protein
MQVNSTIDNRKPHVGERFKVKVPNGLTAGLEKLEQRLVEKLPKEVTAVGIPKVRSCCMPGICCMLYARCTLHVACQAPTNVNPLCFMDLHIGNSHAGRLVFELFVDIVPRTCANFHALYDHRHRPDYPLWLGKSSSVVSQGARESLSTMLSSARISSGSAVATTLPVAESMPRLHRLLLVHCRAQGLRVSDHGAALRYQLTASKTSARHP